jgi:hypothetical protein
MLTVENLKDTEKKILHTPIYNKVSFQSLYTYFCSEFMSLEIF